MQAQFKFDFIRGFFSNFGLFANYTFTKSEAYIGKRVSANYTEAVIIFGQDDVSIYSENEEQERIELPGQAMHTLNAALFYDGGGLYAKISSNYHDSFLYKLGADKDLDEYYDEAFHLDFNASYEIFENIKLFVDLLNLTNAPLRFYVGSEKYISQQEYYSWSGRIGFKMTF
jgi:outer membrane receptor protein involved in Fe transport